MIFIFNYTRLAGEVNGGEGATLRLKCSKTLILNAKLADVEVLYWKVWIKLVYVSG